LEFKPYKGHICENLSKNGLKNKNDSTAVDDPGPEMATSLGTEEARIAIDATPTYTLNRETSAGPSQAKQSIPREGPRRETKL
jgi:hypothetical protein